MIGFLHTPALTVIATIVLFILHSHLLLASDEFSCSKDNPICKNKFEFKKELKAFFSALEEKRWTDFIRFFPRKNQHDFIAILGTNKSLPSTLTNLDQLKSAYKPVMFKKNRTRFKARLKHIIVNGDLAYAESDNNVFVDGENIKKDETYSVNIVFVFKKIDGRWYFIFDYNRPINSNS